MTLIKKFSIFLWVAAAASALCVPGVCFASAEEPGPEPEEEKAASVGEALFDSFGEALEAWEQGTTLTLLADAQSETVTVSEDKTLDLHGHTLSLSEESGSVLSVTGGTLTLEDTVSGGAVSGGNAVSGGGIFVDAHAGLVLLGGAVTGNAAQRDGGGIYVAGKLTLGGDARVTGNTALDGKPSNIFLTNENKIAVSGFSGTAGVSSSNPASPFTEGECEGEFLSDDPEYVTRNGQFVIAPLASVTVAYHGTGKIFPTTSPQSLKNDVTVEGTNVNGAPYRHEIELEFPPAGCLSVGRCEVTVKAHGKDDGESEGAEASFWVDVVAPKLSSVRVSLPEYPQLLYFDTPTSEVEFTVHGSYEDGHSRVIRATEEETAKENPLEPFITDHYILSGTLVKRVEGQATLTVTVGQISVTFSVPVSRYRLSADELTVRDVTVIDRAGAWQVSPEQFVPDLPAGIEAVPTIGGEPFAGSGLGPGVYTVELSFLVEDVENYEISGTRTATLTVNRSSYEVTNDANEVVCSFTTAGGIPPAWKFTAEECDNVRHPALEGDLELLQTEALTLLREDEGKLGRITVRLLLCEEAREREVRLFRVAADGGLLEVDFSRDGDYIVFEGSEFLDTQYVVAADSGVGLYLALAITFGALCAVAGVGFFCYLVFKRKLALRG